MHSVRFPLLALVLAGLASTLSARDNDAKKDLEMLQGTWKVLKMVKGGDATPDDQLKDKKVVIADSKMTLVTSTKTEVADITLDPSQKPAAMDLRPKDAPKEIIVRAIYKLEGETLTICFTLEGKDERPKEFTSAKDSSTGLFVLQRDKK